MTINLKFARTPAKTEWRWNEKSDTDANKEEQLENYKVYDIDTKVIDMSNKKATDMRSNQRVKLVDPDIDDETETKRDLLKLKIKETYAEYTEKYCTEKGEIKSVLNKELQNGMK